MRSPFRSVAALLFLCFSLIPGVASAEASESYFEDTEGKQVDFATVYRDWFGADRYDSNWGRAIAENVGFLGLELFIYWYDPNQNSVDWQYPNLAAKFSGNEVLCFDDNLTRTNWLTHPLAGAAYYGFTRANGIGIVPSFAVATTSSALYEAVLEWREVVSINDLIVTPFAGMALGEFMLQLGDYLNSEQSRPRKLDQVIGPGALGRNVASRALGTVRRIHNRADLPKPPPLVPDDALGLSSAYSHVFRLYGGYDVLANGQEQTGSVFVLGTEAEIIAMPGFLRPSSIDKWYGAGNFTRLTARFGFNDRLRDSDIWVDAHLAGHFSQRLRAGPGGTYGYAREVGVHSALHYVDRSRFARRDQYGVLHVLSPAGNLWLRRGRTHFRFSGDVSPDFAAIHSIAYPRWKLENGGGEGTKSSLVRHGYYNTWGASVGAAAEATIQPVTLSGRGRYGRYGTIEGAERYSDLVTRDVHSTEEILELEAGLHVEPRGGVASYALTGARVARRSRMGDVVVGRVDDRIGVSAGLRF